MDTTEMTITASYTHPSKTTTQWTIEWIVLSLCGVTVLINPITLTAMVQSNLVMVSSVNVCIASLCLSDLLIGVAGFVFSFPYMSVEMASGDRSLKAARFVAAVCIVIAFTMSNINAFLITSDRAIATFSPHNYKTKMSAKRTCICVAAMWMTVVALVSAASAAKVCIHGGISDLEFPTDVLPDPVSSYFHTPWVVAVMLANSILYALIIRSLVKFGHKIDAQIKCRSEKRNTRITRMVVLVIGVMFLGNLPVVITTTLSSHTSSSYMWSNRMAHDLAACLAVVPTFINNFIYVGRMTDFKKSIRSLFCCENISANQVQPQ